MTGVKLTSPDGFVEKGRVGFPIISYPLPPLMHGASQWSVMGQSFVGNKVILRGKFDPADVWKTVESEKANLVMITGDAMARPLLDYISEHAAEHDVTSLFAVVSSAVLFSQSCKEQFMELFPNIMISDSIGSSEGGANGIVRVDKDSQMKGGPTVTAARDTFVLGEDLMPVKPGEMGRLARAGNIPLRYHKDPEKSAATFMTSPDGTRYAVPGDFARLELDGTITLIGRGSVCINSGGEKIFPEEVENSLKSHPEVFDAVVVGVPDDRWGERVTAVVQARAGTTPTLESIQEHCRLHVAGYKVPRQLTLVALMVRSPAGKSDYRWAKQQAMVDAGLEG